MIVSFDQAILNRIERVCHAIQRQAGIDCRAIARVAVTAFTTEVLWSVIGDGVAGKKFWPLSAIGFLAVVLYLPEVLGYQLWSRSRNPEGTANQRKINPGDVILRIWCLMMSIPELTSLVLLPALFSEHSSLIMFTLWQYLIACDPLPPCRGRIREAIAAFFATPAMNRS